MQAQPPRHRPYDKHLRKQVVHLDFVRGVKCSAIARWFSGRPCRKTVQRIIQDYRVHRAVRVPQGWKGFLRSHRKHDAVAAQLLVSIVQDDSCLSCSISSGLSPVPLASIADYNNHNHICICFVLFCFVFSLFCFFRGHNWDIIPASCHNKKSGCSVLLPGKKLNWKSKILLCWPHHS